MQNSHLASVTSVEEQVTAQTELETVGARKRGSISTKGCNRIQRGRGWQQGGTEKSHFSRVCLGSWQEEAACDFKRETTAKRFLILIGRGRGFFFLNPYAKISQTRGFFLSSQNIHIPEEYFSEVNTKNMNLIGFLKSQFLCHLLICYIFIVSGLIINTIQLFTLILWPINKQLFRRINCRLAYCISSQLVMLLEWWSGTDCTLYTHPEDYHRYGKENAIVILNHNFEIDFLCGWNFCERFGVLGSSKVLAKKELSYVPLIGWMWYFLEIVFCTRKWDEDRRTVMQALLNLRDYPENFWFLIHCEGTRFTEQKHQISMQVAEAKGLPKLKYHLLPRTKGFAVTVKCLRNVVSAVYDSTLNFRNNENPTLLGVLNGKKYHADLYVRRIPLEEVPEDEEECSSWLHKLYQEKDAFQEQYYQTGTYPGTAIVSPRRPWTLLNWLFWALLLLYPLFQLLVNMVSSGSSLTLASFALVIFVASVGVRWMIGVTEINRGSAYGPRKEPQPQVHHGRPGPLIQPSFPKDTLVQTRLDRMRSPCLVMVNDSLDSRSQKEPSTRIPTQSCQGGWLLLSSQPSSEQLRMATPLTWRNGSGSHSAYPKVRWSVGVFVSTCACVMGVSLMRKGLPLSAQWLILELVVTTANSFHLTCLWKLKRPR
uniref:1-acyl-sn-glycerol-3-phosphate acyltransferase delta n=1 Tax=Ornithorhynchus anatinus TaxID=9258 RepID=A0A6I8N0M8_ORNAN